ncbi:MAG: preprotein translocase subunit SecG [Sphingobacteriales bacterium]|jgi:preprotein translocase subunit SecG|nr:preprotein translocase subunit SecG [Sphingobacteriales bacterium]
MYTFLLLLVLLICAFLVIFVLVQNPKGGGLGAGFGSTASSLGGVQQTSDFLERGTWVLISALFIVLILSGVFLPQRHGAVPTDGGDDTKTKIEGIIEEGEGE